MEVNDWNAVHAYEDAARVSDAMAQPPVECKHPRLEPVGPTPYIYQCRDCLAIVDAVVRSAAQWAGVVGLVEKWRERADNMVELATHPGPAEMKAARCAHAISERTCADELERVVNDVDH